MLSNLLLLDWSDSKIFRFRGLLESFAYGRDVKHSVRLNFSVFFVGFDWQIFRGRRYGIEVLPRYAPHSNFESAFTMLLIFVDVSVSRLTLSLKP